MVKRDIYLRQLVDSRHNGMIKVVTGVRRCGKSFLLFKLFYEYLKSQGVDDAHIIKVDLEDRRNRSLSNPDNLMEFIDSKMTDTQMYYIMIDEVQLVEEFEQVLTSYLKTDNADVYVTGSNSKFLSKDVITEFRGRGDEIRISPFSFAEFFSVYQGTREQAFEEYLTYGGMPKLLDFSQEAKKMKYLQDLFLKTYFTDIKERYGIRNDDELEELINIVSSSIGSLVSPTKLADTFVSVKKAKISINTIKSYLDILEESFLIEKSIRYDIKGRKYINAPAKYYFTDVGLRNARLNFRQNEAPHLVENVIYNELRRRGFMVDVGVVIVYSKNGNGVSERKRFEVDFVCNQGNKRYYIQSALHLPTKEKREQELHSFMNINDSFQKFIITADPVKPYRDENGVVFMNIYDFLLDYHSLDR